MTIELTPAPQWFSLLEAEPELALELEEREAGLVQRAVARGLELEVPGREPEMIDGATAEGWLGLYVIEAW